MAGNGPLTGKTLNNRYQLGERIGVGGMAEVYSAQDLVLGRIVAVKTMLPQYAADPDFTRRFRQEAAAAANLQSPYIVNVYDWGHEGENYYIVMEYVRGSDLKTAIQERGAIPERKVAEIASQVCQALTVAHQQDIVHRDIKPQNIMVQPDGNVKVMDFGIARAKNSTADKTETVLGTAHYTSPEQAQGKDLTAASDIYSLGVVMYEASTGQLPFDGPDAVSVALMQVKDIPVDPREINPNISPEFDAIIMCAMQKNPQDRFATANDMRHALNDFLAGRPLNLAPLLGSAALGGVAGAAAGAAIAGATGASAGSRNGFTSARTSVMPQIGGTAAMGDPYGGNSALDQTQVMPAGMSPTQTYPGVGAGGSAVRNYQIGDTGSIGRSGSGSGKGSGGRGKKIAIGVVIAAVVIAAILAVLFLGGGERANVPDVVNMTSDEAITAIESAGFKVGRVDNVEDDSVEPGTVLRQTPNGGSEAPKGSTVDLVVAEGSEKLAIPNVTGLQEANARQTLVTAGFTVGQITEEYNDTVEAGLIVSQDPAAGGEANKGTTINLVVSKGKEDMSVPDLSGLSLSSAQSRAEAAGFNVTQSGSEYSDRVEEGAVISQSPAAGSKATKGATISVVISRGPNNTVSVPNVVGSSESYAQSALTNAGLKVNVTQNYSSSVAAGNVISQSPSAGADAQKGDTVTIEVSLGSASSGEDGGEAKPAAE